MGDPDLRAAHARCRPDPGRGACAGRRQGMCPYLEEPFPECHCSEMTSVKIVDAIYFCQQHFSACPVFRSRSRVSEPR
jgi:hypothetical protein